MTITPSRANYAYLYPFYPLERYVQWLQYIMICRIPDKIFLGFNSVVTYLCRCCFNLLRCLSQLDLVDDKQPRTKTEYYLTDLQVNYVILIRQIGQ